MFEEKNEPLENIKIESLETTEPHMLKYPKPKILLLDMKEGNRSGGCRAA